MSLHLDTLSWFRANQSLLFLLNAVCLAEKQQIPIFDLTRSRLEPAIYNTRGEHATHYSTDAGNLLLYKYYPTIAKHSSFITGSNVFHLNNIKLSNKEECNVNNLSIFFSF
jgi:hypothetical protein